MAPFLAVGLYEWLSARDLGSGVFLACLLINLVGLAGFIAMAREVKSARAAGGAAAIGRDA
jgi:hypothetical protein